MNCGRLPTIETTFTGATFEGYPASRAVRSVSRPLASSSPATISTAPDTRVTSAPVVAQGAGGGQHAGQRRAGHDERHAQPEAVDEQQQCALGGPALATGDGQDRRQLGADAGRPADAEGGADSGSAGRAVGRRRRRQLPAAADQRGRRQQHQHAHSDHQRPRHQLEAAAVVEELRAQHAHAGAGQREHRREPRHEPDRGRGHPAPVIAQLAARHATDERQVAGQERPHAGRDERHEAGGEGDGQVGGRRRHASSLSSTPPTRCEVVWP